MQEATRLLGNGHGKQRLALTAEIGALRNMPQAIEVHVGAAVDRDQPLVLPALARHELLDARDRERTRRLDDRARVLKHVLDCRADLIRAQKQDLVDMRATEVIGLFADPLY